MVWYILGLVVAFICGASSLAYSTLAVIQLNAWELGRLDRVRKAVVAVGESPVYLSVILDIIDKESEL